MQQTTSSRALLFGMVIILAGCGDAGRVATEPGRRAVARVSPAAASRNDTPRETQAPRIVSATGDVTAAVNEYRGLLGSLNPNVAGEDSAGRREINWDGVPAALTNNDLFPGNFFNVNSPRGVLFTTEGSTFRISNNGYVDVNPTYAGEFNVFSPPKLFVARGNTITDVRFVVAGSNTPARVTGFGSVFGDVGLESSTTIEYFDAAGQRLLIVRAPRRSDEKGLSFVGAVFDSPIVARVRITSGNTPIGADANDKVTGEGLKHDIVVMDDFIYGEPHHRN